MLNILIGSYLSPIYKKAYPETASQLMANRDRVFTNDLVFELVSGILHAPYRGYDVRNDISSGQYALTPGTARSLRGSVAVSSDREFYNSGRVGLAKAESAAKDGVK